MLSLHLLWFQFHVFNNSNGQNHLEYCFENGIETTKDEEKAFQCYLRSTEGGYCDGQYNTNGIGTTKDEKKAFQWCLKLAKEENSDDKSKPQKDKETAFKRYLKSAEGGNSDGQFLDIVMKWYRTTKDDGEHFSVETKDEEKAFQWYLKSTEGGNNNRQYNLGNYIQNTSSILFTTFRHEFQHNGNSYLNIIFNAVIPVTELDENANMKYLDEALALFGNQNGLISSKLLSNKSTRENNINRENDGDNINIDVEKSTVDKYSNDMEGRIKLGQRK
ncbi:hypothetical protein Glove_151g74 [Diversispora epigaea]|uniref:Uncharacterized protein n=1 Tax=Diversispora epigaea TaxID=1348612 RepID=A0A397J2Q4_9GLOM|nr:hypothetical protein Glove_151g74 [Diversispora epigaea]